jgi:hypothetical protein
LLVCHEAAFFAAWFRRDPDLADRWLAQVRRPELIQHLQRIRINTATFASCSEFKTALEIWKQGFDYIQNLPARAVREALRESWIEWRGKIEERNNALTVM